MKYESELIQEILEKEGHKVPTLHYQSECIKSWVDEAKGAYPKLCDYQSEWLNYINGGDSGGDEEPPIGEFPYETVTTNHTATVNHVVPLAYKSAILKGQTLANRVSEQSFGGNTMVYEHRFYDNPFQQGETFTIFVVNPNVTTIKVGLHRPSNGGWVREEQYNVNNNKRVVYTVPSGDFCCKYVGVVVRTSNDTSGFENSLVIVSGDKSNLEIENYFEGMQSVQMPVLTTTGKNLLPPVQNTWYSCSFKQGTTFTLSTKDLVPSNGGNVIFKDINGTDVWFSIDSGKTTSTKELPCDVYYINNSLAIGVEHQLEIGNQATSYEPYQSIILTVNEDVELHGIGDVKDELNLLTGELTQRIGESVLDGSEDWATQPEQHPSCYSFYINTPLTSSVSPVMCNQFSNLTTLGSGEGMLISGSGRLNINILKTKLNDSSIESFKTWLKSNHTQICYVVQETVKTVDLTVVNQDEETLSKIKPIEGTMHVEVSGTPINPTAALEVPVEAITQNLNSFIEGE